MDGTLAAPECSQEDYSNATADTTTCQQAHSLLLNTVNGETHTHAYKHTYTHYLAQDIWVGVILQQYCSSARVIIARRDVQGWQSHLALGAVVDEESYYVLVALLEGHCQGRETILTEEAGTEATSVHCTDSLKQTTVSSTCNAVMGGVQQSLAA